MKSFKQMWRASLFAFLASLASSAKAGPAHVALRAEVETQADTVLLVHLLSGRAPDQLLHSLEGITFGPAPRPGCTRRLTRSTVLGVLQANGLSTSAFDIPDSIRVHRTGHELTSDEVWTAIESSLSSTSRQSMLGFRPEDIRFDSSIVVPSAGTRLKLSQAKYDPLLGEARFRLISSDDRSVLPFYVTAKLGPSVPKASPTENGSWEEVTHAAILVEPKKLAILRLHSANSESNLRVRPLMPGRLGEVVPVRLLSTHRTLKARVVDFGLVDAAF